MYLKHVQRKQAEYDEKYFEHNATRLEKVRHLTLHMGKLLGKLSAYCEVAEHGKEPSSEQIEREVVPDLLIYSMRLANEFGVETEESFFKRVEDNIKRLGLESS